MGLPPNLTEEQREFLREQREFLWLRGQWLEKERGRSDPGGTWLKELEWQQDAMQRPLPAASAERLLENMGYDFLEV
jgi:hypothetical protein